MANTVLTIRFVGGPWDGKLMNKPLTCLLRAQAGHPFFVGDESSRSWHEYALYPVAGALVAAKYVGPKPEMKHA
jgi:hypothetical protein